MSGAHFAEPMAYIDVAQLCNDAIRVLAVGALEQAKSGYRGAPVELPPLVYTRRIQVMQFDPQDSNWPNPNEIRHSLRLDSRAPGHCEYRLHSGVSTITFGQGCRNTRANGDAEKWLARHFTWAGFEIRELKTCLAGPDR
jgi:transketolase